MGIKLLCLVFSDISPFFRLTVIPIPSGCSPLKVFFFPFLLLECFAGDGYCLAIDCSIVVSSVGISAVTFSVDSVVVFGVTGLAGFLWTGGM